MSRGYVDQCGEIFLADGMHGAPKLQETSKGKGWIRISHSLAAFPADINGMRYGSHPACRVQLSLKNFTGTTT